MGNYWTRPRDAGAEELIVDELVAILLPERLEQYANDDSGNDSLESERSLVRLRLGGDYDPEAWDDAMELIRERYQRA